MAMLFVPRLAFVAVSYAVPTAHSWLLVGQVMDRGTVNCWLSTVIDPTCTLHDWPKTRPVLAATAASGRRMAHARRR